MFLLSFVSKWVVKIKLIFSALQTDLGHRGEDTIKIDFIQLGCEPNSSGSRQMSVAGLSEYNGETSGLKTCEGLLSAWITLNCSVELFKVRLGSHFGELRHKCRVKSSYWPVKPLENIAKYLPRCSAIQFRTNRERGITDKAVLYETYIIISTKFMEFVDLIIEKFSQRAKYKCNKGWQSNL